METDCELFEAGIWRDICNYQSREALQLPPKRTELQQENGKLLL